MPHGEATPKLRGSRGAKLEPPVLRVRTPPLLAFAAFSAAVHAGLFLVAGAGATRPRHDATPLAFEPTTETLAGETLDVEPPADSPAPAEPSEDTPLDTQETPPTPPTPGASPSPPAHPATLAALAALATHAAHASPADRPASSHAAAAGAPPSLYGAVGVRFATDLATTFTRAFPQTASADGVWGSVPFGSAGTADVLLTIDDTGHLTGSHVGGAPSDALRRGIERTLALLRPRTFVARGATTHLRVTARVGHDDVHDGLHGEVFALSGGSFSGDVGTAFFALPSAGGGRRIDVELRLLP